MYCPNCEFEIKQDVIECPICGGELTELAEEGADTNADNADSEKKHMSIDTSISDLLLDAKHELDSFDSKPGSEPQPIEPLSSSLDFESILSEETAATEPPADEPALTTEPEALNTELEIPQEKEDIFSLDDTSMPFPESSPLESEPNAEQETQPENLFADDKLFINEAAASPAAADTSPFIPEIDMPLESEAPAEQEKQPENLFADDKLFINEAASSPAAPDTSPFIPEIDMPLESEAPAEQEKQPENLFADDKLFINEAASSPAAPDTSPFIPEIDIPLENGPLAEQETQPENLFADDKLFINEAASSPAAPDTSPFIPEIDLPLESQAPAEQEKQPENLFADDKLFSNEATTSPAAPDTNAFLEELTETQSEIKSPKEQSSDLPWSLDELSALEPTESTTVSSAAQAEQSDDMAQNDPDFMGIADAGPTAKEDKQDNGPRSKKRLIFLILFGILIIGGAYLLQDYLPLISGSDQIQKAIPSRMAPPVVKKPLTLPEPIQPATSALLEKAALADAAPDKAQQQAIEPQPEPSPSKDIHADTAEKKPVPEQITISKEKPEPAAIPVKRIQDTAPLPDKEKSPAKLAYSIHVSSFKKQQSADEQIKNLRTNGFEAYLETVDLGEKGIWHRVKVGHYATRTEAKQAIKIIQQKNPGPTPIININR